MYRKIAVAVMFGVGVMAGCTTNELDAVGTQPREAITYAAQASYPKGMHATDSVKLVAFNDTDKKTLQIHNLDMHTFPTSTVWVNKAFLAKLPPIVPKGSVEVKYSDLLEAGQGVSDLSKVKGPVTTVELQSEEGLFTVQGPAVRKE